MPASFIGSSEIAANSGTDWFIHGYGPKDAFTFSIIVDGQVADGVPFPLSHCTLTTGSYFKHVDGTYAQTIHIQNNAPFNPCFVRIYDLFDTAP